MKKDEQISAMVERLRELRAADRGERIPNYVLRWIEDPLKPRTKQGKFRINPILVLLLSLATLAAGTYTWTVEYEGDDNNEAATDQGGPAEQTVVGAASLSLVTIASRNVRLPAGPPGTARSSRFR